MGGKWKAKNSRISCFLSIFQRKLWVNHNRFNPHMHKMGPRGHKPFSFGDHFYSKNARKLRFYVFLHFNARKHIISLFYLKWTEFTRIVNLFRFSSGNWAPTIEIKFPNSCEFDPLQVKWRCHMFSNMKKKKYMESELSGIFE